MKIPLQEKIAELEQRIARLEEHARGDTTAIYSRISKNGKTTESKGFGPHWILWWISRPRSLYEMQMVYWAVRERILSGFPYMRSELNEELRRLNPEVFKKELAGSLK